MYGYGKPLCSAAFIATCTRVKDSRSVESETKASHPCVRVETSYPPVAVFIGCYWLIIVVDNMLMLLIVNKE